LLQYFRNLQIYQIINKPISLFFKRSADRTPKEEGGLEKLILMNGTYIAFLTLPPLKQWGSSSESSVNLLGAAIIVVLLSFLTVLTYATLEGFALHVQGMGVSIVWGLFSICSVFYGMRFDVKKIRLFGIALIFFVLLKLVFVDMHFVSIVIRATLFIALGVIGIAMSRLFYNRKG
jgi:uncharacterized membrane protein